MKNLFENLKYFKYIFEIIFICDNFFLYLNNYFKKEI